MGRFQLLNLEVLGYGLELRFWVVIAIIVSVTNKNYAVRLRRHSRSRRRTSLDVASRLDRDSTKEYVVVL